MIEVGSKVLTTGSNHRELIGLKGTVTKEWNFKPEYVSTFWTDKFFRVRFDEPVHINGKISEYGLFKKTDLKNIDVGGR